MNRLTLRISKDGSLELEGKAITFQELENRLERDKADGITTMIVGNVSEDIDWDIIKKPLDLLQRFDRTPVGIVGGRQA